MGDQRAALRSALSRRAGPRPVLDACTQVGLADDAASAASFKENNPLNGGYKEYGRHDYLPPAAFPMINAAYATKQQREESDVSGQPASGFLVSPVGKCLTQGEEIRGDMWGDVGRYGVLWGSASRKVGRYGEIWGDMERYGEIWGDVPHAVGDSCLWTWREAERVALPVPPP